MEARGKINGRFCDMNVKRMDKKTEDKKTVSKDNIVREIISTSIYFLFVLLATWLIITYVGQRTEVDGISMYSYLNDHDQLITDKLSYRFHDPERFDIVVFPYPQDKSEYFIKRIIGLPGETVRIDTEGNIYINEQLLEEDYGEETIAANMVGRAEEPITLGEDEYFVMGDNRNYSMDSRDPRVGNIKRSDLIGKAFVRVWPLNQAAILKK